MSSIYEWVNKTWYIHIIEYYSAVKRMKYLHILQHVYLENIMLI